MRLLTSVILLLCSLQATAFQQISNLYETIVVVEATNESQRKLAIQQGFENVLVAFTGFSGIANLEAVVKELPNAKNYIVEYGTDTVSVANARQLGSMDKSAYWIRYNKSAIEQFVAQKKLPIWPTNRTNIQMFILANPFSNATFVDYKNYPGIANSAMNFLKVRGVEATLETSATYSAAKLWSLSDQTLQALIAESGQRVTAIAKVSINTPTKHLSNKYTLNLLLVDQSGVFKSSQVGSDIETMFDKGLSQYLDQLSLQASFIGGLTQQAQMVIQIRELQSFSEYRRVLHQLEGLQQIDVVRMDGVDDVGVRFLISYTADAQFLINSIEKSLGVKQIKESSMPSTYNNSPRTRGGTKDRPIVFTNMVSQRVDEDGYQDKVEEQDNALDGLL